MFFFAAIDTVGGAIAIILSELASEVASGDFNMKCILWKGKTGYINPILKIP